MSNIYTNFTVHINITKFYTCMYKLWNMWYQTKCYKLFDMITGTGIHV